MREGNWKRAKRLAKGYTLFWPDDPNSWMVRYDVLSRHGEADRAEAVILEALRRHPSAPLVVERLAEMRMDQGRYDEARSVLHELRRADGACPVPYFGLAELADLEGDPAARIRFAHEAIERLSPAFRVLPFKIALLLLAEPTERETVVRLLREFSDQSPDEYFPHLVLAVLLEGTDPSASRAHLDRARRLSWLNEASFEAEIEEIRERAVGSSVVAQ